MASFHLHPEVGVEATDAANEFRLEIGEGRSATFRCEGGVAVVEDTTWHPEFGLSVPNQVIRCRFDGGRLECRLRWADD